MQRQLSNLFDSSRPSLSELSGCCVPQEHISTPDKTLPPRDWSHLGQRVLAKAWRRLTDDRVTRRTSRAAPVVPAPNQENGQ